MSDSYKLICCSSTGTYNNFLSVRHWVFLCQVVNVYTLQIKACVASETANCVFHLAMQVFKILQVVECKKQLCLLILMLPWIGVQSQTSVHREKLIDFIFMCKHQISCMKLPFLQNLKCSEV